MNLLIVNDFTNENRNNVMAKQEQTVCKADQTFGSNKKTQQTGLRKQGALINMSDMFICTKLYKLYADYMNNSC